MKNILCILLICLLLCPSVYAEGPDIKSSAAILIDAETGQILYEKNKDEKHYPASITKILTLYIASLADGSEVMTASESAIKAVPKDTSNIAIDYGEELTLEQGMYAAMLMSANDACNVIAEHISGSVDEFVIEMNKTAKAFGARNSNFSNSNGLYNENHYTTAYDFALITMNAIKNENFLKVFSTEKYTIPYTNKKDEERNFVTQHRMMHWAQYSDMCVIGGKSGFTTESGYTLVTYGEKNGNKVIAVVLKAPDFNAVYDDTQKLLEYGYERFRKVKVVSDNIEPRVDGYTTYTPLGETEFMLDKAIVEDELIYTFSDNSVTVADNNGNMLSSLDVNVTVKVPWWKNAFKIVMLVFAVLIGLMVIAYIRLIIIGNKKRKRRLKRRLK